MTDTVFCKKFKEELPALQMPPMPGQKGQDLLLSISQKAWDEWKSHQTTLINEKRLDMSNADSRKWLMNQMDKYFNNEDYEKASGFKALGLKQKLVNVFFNSDLEAPFFLIYKIKKIESNLLSYSFNGII